MIPFADIVTWDRDESGKIIGVKSTELVFTHVSHYDDTVRHFAVDRMNKVAVDRAMEVLPIKMDFDTWNMIRLNFGVEQHRINRLTPDICKTNPTLWVELPDRPEDPNSICTAIMVDGAHRYTYAFGVLGWDRIPGCLFRAGEWEEFLIDIPEELSKMDEERIRAQCGGGEQFWSGIS